MRERGGGKRLTRFYRTLASTNTLGPIFRIVPSNGRSARRPKTIQLPLNFLIVFVFIFFLLCVLEHETI